MKGWVKKQRTFRSEKRKQTTYNRNVDISLIRLKIFEKEWKARKSQTGKIINKKPSIQIIKVESYTF